jgi:uncharacterized coiled-coil protein SlyX
MKHPLSYTQHEITMLEEQRRQQDARIEALEAALWEIRYTVERINEIASAAFDKDELVP